MLQPQRTRNKTKQNENNECDTHTRECVWAYICFWQYQWNIKNQNKSCCYYCRNKNNSNNNFNIPSMHSTGTTITMSIIEIVISFCFVCLFLFFIYHSQTNNKSPFTMLLLLLLLLNLIVVCLWLTLAQSLCWSGWMFGLFWLLLLPGGVFISFFANVKETWKINRKEVIWSERNAMACCW